jgi:hypothetical protein
MKNNVFSYLRTVQLSLNAKVSVVVFFMFGTLIVPPKVTAQTLAIEINSLPDTVLINSIFEASFTIHNLSADAQLGNLQIWFLNESNDSIAAPLGGFNVNQYFAAAQPRTFDLIIPVTPDFFRQGGNTVVIWPSFVGQPILGDSTFKEIYVLDPNNIKKPVTNDQVYFFPNPAGSSLSVKASPKSAIAPSASPLRPRIWARKCHARTSSGFCLSKALSVAIAFVESPLRIHPNAPSTVGSSAVKATDAVKVQSISQRARCMLRCL